MNALPRRLTVDMSQPILSTGLKEAIEQAQVLVFPTDTVYGIGCRADDPIGVARIKAIKERPQQQPLPLLFSDRRMVGRWVQLTHRAHQLADQHWPGALTMVLPRWELAPLAPLLQTPWVGVRIPDIPVLRVLIEQIGVPLVGTSANRHGDPSLTDIPQDLPDWMLDVDLVLDGGPSPLAHASTVVRVEGDQVTILRQGSVYIT